MKKRKLATNNTKLHKGKKAGIDSRCSLLKPPTEPSLERLDSDSRWNEIEWRVGVSDL